MRFAMSRVLVATIAVPLWVVTAAAQSRTAVSVEAGALLASDESLLQVGVRAAPTRGGFGTVDFAFAICPRLLSEGIVLFAMDFDGTYGAPQDDSQVAFFPRAGISILGGGQLSGSGGGGAAVGYNAGAGLFLRASPQLGLRFDYTYRRFLRFDVAFSSLTAGLVFAH